MARLYANKNFPLPTVEALRIHTALEARPQMAGQLVHVNRLGERSLASVSLQRHLAAVRTTAYRRRLTGSAASLLAGADA